MTDNVEDMSVLLESIDEPYRRYAAVKAEGHPGDYATQDLWADFMDAISEHWPALAAGLKAHRLRSHSLPELDEWERLAKAARDEEGELKGPASWDFVAFSSPERVLRIIQEIRNSGR